MTQEEKRIQREIDKLRKKGVEIEVHHIKPEEDAKPEDGFLYTGETQISVCFSDEYDALVEADKIRNLLEEECDSGAGFGYRDLQLCRLLPNIK